MTYEAWRTNYPDSDHAARMAYQQLERLINQLDQIDQTPELHAHQKWAVAKAVLGTAKENIPCPTHS